MHVVLACFGTDGDIFPYVAIGLVLRAREHRITLAANAHYHSLAAAHGFAFAALGSDEETNALLNNPDSWHPLKSLHLGGRWAIRSLDSHYAVLANLAQEDETLLVASTIIFAARVAAEKFQRPMASVVLQPWVIRSSCAPPVMPAGLTLPAWAPRWFKALYWRGADLISDSALAPHINRLRSSIGLKPVRRIFDWCLSPELIIGLFPEAFAKPQPDWPPQLRLAGFTTSDGSPTAGLPADLLEFCRAGKPTVAVTFGTGMKHAAQIFRAVREALEILDWRGLFLTRYSAQLPLPLPPSIRQVEFASFRELFPHCAAVIHHGGIGTSAKALMAGTPQLIIPFAYDQKDNAIRVKNLGAGLWIKGPQATGPKIAEALRTLIASSGKRETISRLFGKKDAAELAAIWIEELAQRRAELTLNR